MWLEILDVPFPIRRPSAVYKYMVVENVVKMSSTFEVDGWRWGWRGCEGSLRSSQLSRSLVRSSMMLTRVLAIQESGRELLVKSGVHGHGTILKRKFSKLR